MVLENAALSFVLLSGRAGGFACSWRPSLLSADASSNGSRRFGGKREVSARRPPEGLPGEAPSPRPRRAAAIIEVFLPSPHVCCCLDTTFSFSSLPHPARSASPPTVRARCQALALLIPEPCMWLKCEAGSAAKPQGRNGALAEENRPLFWVLEVDAGR